MGIKIIYGGISSGKREICLQEIEKIHGEKPEARCVMIVPNHYSYETERRFVERFGGIGLNNIEVLTLRQMAINTLTANELNHLTEAGRQMLIYKAVKNACSELVLMPDMDKRLVASMGKEGFLDNAASLISEMKRYMVSPEDLKEKARSVEDNKTLENKLRAFSLLYANYTEYVALSGSADGDDDLRILAEHIEREDVYGKDTYVWIDRFDFFLPQQLRVIEALLSKGVNLTVSVCCDTQTESARELYAKTLPTLNAVRRLAGEHGGYEEIRTENTLSDLTLKPDLYTLITRWNEEFVYDTVPQNIRVFEARDTYSEVERIACEIVDLVRGGDIRYRDIAMMCGDENEYIHLVEAIFKEYEIPYFTDRTIILSDHPIAMQILALFRVLEENWSYDSVMSYLRAGYVYTMIGKGVFPLDQNAIDRLENYILRCGIRGEKRWLRDDKWYEENDIMATAFGDEDKGKEDAALDYIDNLRRSVAAPVAAFAKKAKGKHLAKDFAEYLFEFLGHINLYNGIKYEVSRFKKNGDVTEAERFTKIWNLILDVLNQTATAIGDEEITLEDFAEYLKVGLTKCEIRIIPSGIDQVYVGSAERLTKTKIKVIFAAGAKNGTYPAGIKTEGFFSDRDRNCLKEDFNITIAPDTKKKTDEQYFKVYRAIATVREKLYISYSIQNEEGKSQSKARFLLDVERKFPKVTRSDNLTPESNNGRAYISAPKATMHRMLINLSSRNKRAGDALWQAVYRWYKDKEEWQTDLSMIDRADYYDRKGVMLKEDIAARLYEGKVSYSPTRLNTFSACPFKYFMQYGLKAKTREEWDISPMSMGIYAHRVIHDFCARVEKDAKSDKEKIEAWRGLGGEERDSLVNEIIEDTCQKITASSVRDKEKTESILRRMGKTIRQSAILVQQSLGRGSFAEHGMEREFDVSLTDKVALRGTIDRIDMCEGKDGRKYLRIIDYKTGSTEFDVVDIYGGYNMQMVLYALAMNEEIRDNNMDVTGIYYTVVRDEYKKIEKDVTEANVDSAIGKNMVLDGETFADDDETKKMNTVCSIDNGIIDKGFCDFVKVKIDDENIHGVRSLDEINGLMEKVKERVTEIDEKSRGGVIDLNPYETGKDKSACSYCDFAAVCKFDDKYKKIRKRKGTKDEIWDEMKIKGAAMRGVEIDAKLDD